MLIVAALTDSQLKDFYQLSTELGMDVLVEVHDLDEAEKLKNEIRAKENPQAWILIESL